MDPQPQPPLTANPRVLAAAAAGAVFCMLVGAAATYFFMKSGSRQLAVAPPPRVVAGEIAPMQAPSAPRATVTQPQMEALANRISSGDSVAITELEVLADDLYRGINYEKERDRVLANLRLMKVVYDKLGADAGANNPKAMAALRTSLASQSRLRSFAPDALGIAAAAGNSDALEILLHYKANGILQSTAVFAMAKAAQKNNPQAIDFLVEVIDDSQARGLWHGAAQGLRPAALKGNKKAAEALLRYERNDQAQRRRPSTRPTR